MVMDASTLKRRQTRDFGAGQQNSLHSFFDREAFYVDTSMLFQTCTVTGGIRLQNRDMITHQDRTEKVTEQYMIRNRACIL